MPFTAIREKTECPRRVSVSPTAGFDSHRLHYHGSPTHLALDKDGPEPRERQSIDDVEVISIPMIGGLHHRHTRSAA